MQSNKLINSSTIYIIPTCDKPIKVIFENRKVDIDDINYFITGVEDGWIHVDKETWKEYLKVKKKK